MGIPNQESGLGDAREWGRRAPVSIVTVVAVVVSVVSGEVVVVSKDHDIAFEARDCWSFESA